MSEKNEIETQAYKVSDDEKGVFKTSKRLEQFGENQNEVNKLLLETINELKERVNNLEEEQKLNIERFKRVAAELQTYKNELDRMRLVTQLNSNAIDRIVKSDGNDADNLSTKKDKKA